MHRSIDTNYSLSMLQPHKCKFCKKCFVCHRCLQSKASIFRANSSDSEEEIRAMCESSARNHYEDIHPRYILVGPNNEIEEADKNPVFPSTRQKLKKIATVTEEDVDDPEPMEDVENKVGESSEEEEPVSLDCDICKKTFSSKHDLDIHLIYHSTEEVHECKICGLQFDYSYELIKHSLNHKNPNNVCEYCRKEFRTAERLRVHMTTHTGDVPFSCVVCDKGFKDNTRLKSHLQCHIDEKPFACEKCGKCFRRKSQLSTHSWVHAEVKPYNCQFCEKPFTYKCNLQLHMQRTHNVFE